jgi:hypothetical protein
MLLDAKAEAKRDEMARCKPIQQGQERNSSGHFSFKLMRGA